MNGHRLDPAWQPCQTLLLWAKARRPDLDLVDTLDQFKDYWCARPGKDATKLDWDATFRNWVRRAYALPQVAREAKPASFQRAGSVRRMSDSDRAKTVGEHLPAIMRQLGMKV